MSKLLQIVQERRRVMNESWMDSFEKFNIAADIAFIYKQNWTLEFANRVFAYTIMAYDKDSGWVDIYKNRLDNKKKIMERLGGNLKDKETLHVVENASIAAGELRAWFMNYQRDWRWDTIMNCFDFHANQMALGGFKTMQEEEEIRYVETENGIQEEKTIRQKTANQIIRENKDRAETMREAIRMREQGEEYLEQIRKEYSTLDTVLEKEGFTKMTDAHDPGSWEQFIKRVRTPA